MINRIPELLSPAGSLEGFEAALGAGADAFYAGGSLFGARAYAKNFSGEEMCCAIRTAHIHGKKFYLTVNTLLKNSELFGTLYEYLAPFYEAGVDAVLVQDAGVLSFLRREFPALPLHASTQMTVTGTQGAAFLKEQGIKRIVLSRELTLPEIRAVHEKCDIELEAFVHGALCYSYSGRCLMSSLLGGRSGNRGRCAQPCRLPYLAHAPGERPSARFAQDSTLLNLRDLNAIELLPELLEAGIISLKIEGRMKQPSYAAAVTSVYRKYLDLYLKEGKEGFHVAEEDLRYLIRSFSRGGGCSAYYGAYNGPHMLAPPDEKKITEESTAYRKPSMALRGSLAVVPGEPLRFTVSGGGESVTVSSGTAEAPERLPMQEEDFRKPLLKLGNTYYRWETLDIVLQGEAFVPVGALNRLRREAILALEDKLCQKSLRSLSAGRKARSSDDTARPVPERGTDVFYRTEKARETSFFLSASCPDAETARILLSKESPVRRVYLPLAAALELAEYGKENGKEIWLSLPEIIRREIPAKAREAIRDFLKKGTGGILVHDLEGLAFVKEAFPGCRIGADASLYTWNEEAAAFYKENGCRLITAPLELSERELRIRDNTDGEICIYGYLPAMISAQCTAFNSSACDRKERRLLLRDRTGADFPVQCFCNIWKPYNTGAEKSCYNIIYNTVPLDLSPAAGRITGLGFASGRLCFTGESERQIREILKRFERAFLRGETVPAAEPSTRGHFKRGAE